MADGNGSLWLCTSQGVVRRAANAWEYLAGKRYLPDDRVENIFPESPRVVWVLTAGGISRIEYRPMTLEPGFPTRAYIRKGDYRRQDGVWRFTSDGEWEWKGDTSSDELVGHFFAYSLYHPLFRYERDPGLRRIFLRGLEQWWENCRREKDPLWIYIRNLAAGKRADLDDALWALARIPMDLVEWPVRNSHRADVQMSPEPDRFGRPQALTLLPPDERPVMKWNGNPFRVDGGNDGRGEDDGAFYLLPYWLGRFHGYLPGLPGP